MQLSSPLGMSVRFSRLILVSSSLKLVILAGGIHRELPLIGLILHPYPTHISAGFEQCFRIQFEITMSDPVSVVTGNISELLKLILINKN